MMKKIAIIIIFALLMVSCEKYEENKIVNTATAAPLTSFAYIEKEPSREFCIYKLVEEGDVFNEEDYSLWKSYVKQEYDLDIHYIQFNIINRKMANLSDSEVPSLPRLVYADDYRNLKRWVESEMLSDLKDYLTINKYDADALQYLLDEKGRIKMLPTKHEKVYKYRTYDKDVLDELNIPVPTTLEEFYQLAKIIKYEYQADNGKDTYIATYNAKNCQEDLTDIFMAFGCYFNLDFYCTSIAYNPITMQIEDAAQSENFKQAVSYIKLLIDEGLIYESSSESYTDNINVVSYYKERNSIGFSNNEYGLYLEGTNDKYLVYCNDVISGIAFERSVNEDLGIIKIFENEIYTEEKARLFFTYGFEGENYSINDNELSINIDSEVKVPKIVFNCESEFDSVKYLYQGNVVETLDEKQHIIDEIASELDSDKIYHADMNIHYLYRSSTIALNRIKQFISLRNELLYLLFDFFYQGKDKEIDIDSRVQVYINESNKVIDFKILSDYLKENAF